LVPQNRIRSRSAAQVVTAAHQALTAQSGRLGATQTSQAVRRCSAPTAAAAVRSETTRPLLGLAVLVAVLPRTAAQGRPRLQPAAVLALQQLRTVAAVPTRSTRLEPQSSQSTAAVLVVATRTSSPTALVGTASSEGPVAGPVLGQLLLQRLLLRRLEVIAMVCLEALQVRAELLRLLVAQEQPETQSTVDRAAVEAAGLSLVVLQVGPAATAARTEAAGAAVE